MSKALTEATLTKGMVKDIKKVCSFTLRSSVDEWLNRYVEQLKTKFPESTNISRSAIVETILKDYMERNGNA